MPKQIQQYKKFLQLVKKADPAKGPKTKKTIYIKKNRRDTKFKIRRGKHLFTFKTDNGQTIKKVTTGLDNNQIQKIEIKKKKIIIKKKK